MWKQIDIYWVFIMCQTVFWYLLSHLILSSTYEADTIIIIFILKAEESETQTE